jgi:hypothetical protein
VHLTAQDTRYVRLDVSQLGLPLREPGFPDPVWRLQLAEIAVLDPSGNDVAQGAGVTASESFTVAGAWKPAFLTDGQLVAGNGRFGYTSFERHGAEVSPDIWVQLDLGAVRSVDEVLLYRAPTCRPPTGRCPTSRSTTRSGRPTTRPDRSPWPPGSPASNGRRRPARRRLRCRCWPGRSL